MINTIAKLGAFNVWANETLLRRLDSSVAAGQEAPQPARRQRIGHRHARPHQRQHR